MPQPSQNGKAPSSLLDQPVDDLALAGDEFYSQDAAYADEEEDVRAGSNLPTFSFYNRMPDADGTETRHTGWHAPKGKWPGAFEDAMAAAEAEGRVQSVKIVHTNDKGESIDKDYWKLLSPRVFILSKGLPPAWKMRDFPDQNVGIVYGWAANTREDEDKEKKGISTVKFQGLVVNLLKYDFAEPVVFQCKRTWTLDMFKVLRAHQQVIDIANSLLRAKQQPQNIRFRHIAVDLLVAPKYEWRGKGEKKRECYPIVSAIPAKEIGEEYIKAHYCGKYRAVIDDLLEAAVLWSREAGKFLAGGASDGAEQQNGNGHIASTNGDPFADELSDPDILDSDALATSDQRTTLAGYATTLRRAGQQEAAAKITRALGGHLTSNEAIALTQEYSVTVFNLQKGGGKK